MKAGYHTFEVADKCCPYGTEIDMDEHEERNEEAYDYMKKDVDLQPASA